MALPHLVIRPAAPSPRSGPVEVVERKGLGHPDTLCDAIAERICVRLCQHYRDRFGVILHHNVDKVLLCGGASRARFGGGEVLEPIHLYLAGRASDRWQDATIPVPEIAVTACREVLTERLPELELERHVRITPHIRAGSADLVQLFGRAEGTPLANDTSCGVGFAPLTDLERVVLAVEAALTGAETRRQQPAVGSDIKVMGVRRNDRIELTVGCAFIGRHLHDLQAYVAAKDAVRALVLESARKVTAHEVGAEINAADDLRTGDVFLTVIGTSAEAGDDGEVGRGNRSNGLITPYRPMTMEAAAGKNPVSHVGKIYNLVAGRVAAKLVAGVPGLRGASCILVSRIGCPVTEPQAADVELLLPEGARLPDLRPRVEQALMDELQGTARLREELIQERVPLF